MSKAGCGEEQAITNKPNARKLRKVILFVSDMDPVAFYRDVLGWPLKCQSPERTEFATEETTRAMLCASKPSGAAAVQGHVAGRCQLGLWGDDVKAFYQDGGPGEAGRASPRPATKTRATMEGTIL